MHSFRKDLPFTPVQTSPSDCGVAPPLPILDDDEAGLDKIDGLILSEEKLEHFQSETRYVFVYFNLSISINSSEINQSMHAQYL